MKPENVVRGQNGRFISVYKVLWSLENFNEGYIPKYEKRFMVRAPGRHRANANGWVLRSIIAYETYYPGEKISPEFVIHHKDRNKFNDSKENLEKLKFGEHTKIHWLGKSRKGQNDHLKTGKEMICSICKKKFYRAKWGILKRNYCSKKCWYQRNKTICTCDTCGKQFEKFKHRVREFNFCSHACIKPKWCKDHPLNMKKENYA